MFWLVSFVFLLLSIVSIVVYLTFRTVRNLVELNNILNFNQLLDEL